MPAFQVQNQWGGSSAMWNQGSTWLLGSRTDQFLVSINIKSMDHGNSFTGSITYENEGPIDFKATNDYGNVYNCEVRWGGSSGSWHSEGSWVIGGRANQRCIQLDVMTNGDKKLLTGDMIYDGEGPIGFKGNMVSSVMVENQWGGSSAPWQNGGTFVLSGRDNQLVISMDISSNDNGKTFSGNMTYAGEGPIGFRGKNIVGNTYEVENQWGGTSAPWHRGGDMIIGCRKNQLVVKLKFSSNDGEKLEGEMTYMNEGPIGFKAQLVPIGQEIHV